MIPTSFEQSNDHLGKPEGYTNEQCEALAVWRGITSEGLPLVISCWKLTKEELELINKTGRVWLWIHGETMPPAALTVEDPWKS